MAYSSGYYSSKRKRLALGPSSLSRRVPLDEPGDTKLSLGQQPSADRVPLDAPYSARIGRSIPLAEETITPSPTSRQNGPSGVDNPYSFSPSVTDPNGLNMGVPRKAENAMQRWTRSSFSPPDRTLRNAYGFTPGQVRAADTGRIDASTRQSPLDTTPSATQARPAMGGITEQSAWNETFQAGMPSQPKSIVPMGGNFATTQWASYRQPERLSTPAPFMPTMDPNKRVVALETGDDRAVKRQLDVMEYNRTGMMSPELRARRKAYGGWTPY